MTTILNCDTIVVLDKGEVVEHDSPLYSSRPRNEETEKNKSVCCITVIVWSMEMFAAEWMKVYFGKATIMTIRIVEKYNRNVGSRVEVMYRL